ncbi:hypothetical protein [Pseudomonas gingeri]|uniref:hypothetical protein n=1 Tax=Pseudomonas gingeri TaxID=117681 RepID=UPI0015A23628|nr:hypothetical protein [Pseudomonas gingeri]NWA04822.1 hypothetical protein [Pseudomonas gingeri]NWA17703.1 hypothetical protein [Pseudomonas gingeri]NWA56889.1 hypothetical protein [Pseudomonas gingeri]NWA97245.1 hypothetical protein [Pseudomonas gingeri]NWB01703.1 hypothetical protein [Pseudomonas gingeri]
MSDEDNVLSKLLEYGHLDRESDTVRGIAQRALDEGYNTLSERQKNVLAPFLTRECEGVTDPGGHHNNCSTELEGNALVEALDSESYGDGFICESCRDESSFYDHQLDRLKDE